MRIVLAQNDLSTVVKTEKLLVEMSFKPIIARDGLEAWDLIKKHRIQMVLCDMQLPRVDGLSLCRKIRTIETYDYTYVVILVDRKNKQGCLEIFKTGADDYLLKPIEPILLKARLQNGERIIRRDRKNKVLRNTLMKSRNKFRVVFDALPEEIIATDLQGRIESVNRTFVDNRNADFKDFWHQQIQADKIYFTDDLDRVVFQASFNSVANTGKPVLINDMKARQGKELRHKRLQFLPVIGEDGQIIQIMVVAQDITDEHHNRAEIDQLNQKLRKLLKIVHEKNVGLQATIERLKESDSEAPQSKSIPPATEAVEKLAHKIGNVAKTIQEKAATLSEHHHDIISRMAEYRSLLAEIESSPADGETQPPAYADRIKQVMDHEQSAGGDNAVDSVPDLLKAILEAMEQIKKITMDLQTITPRS